MKMKEIKDKLNPKVAVIGSALVVSTSLGTCYMFDDEPEAEEEVVEPAPVDEPESEGIAKDATEPVEAKEEVTPTQ